MKNTISRTVKTYTATFGKFDVESMSTYDLSTKEYLSKPSKRTLNFDAPTGCVVLSVKEVEGTYSMPLSVFIEQCRIYGHDVGPDDVTEEAVTTDDV